MKKVLVLEDDPQDTRIPQFRKRFEARGWKADFVKTASACIDLLKRNEYDAVFLDHDLGGEVYVDCAHKNTGSEVARWWVENDHPNKGATVIIHSFNEVGALYMARLIKGSHWIRSVWTRDIFDQFVVGD